MKLTSYLLPHETVPVPMPHGAAVLIKPMTLPQRAASFAKSMVVATHARLTKNLPFYVSDTIKNQRWAICKNCPRYDARHERCGICKCGSQRNLTVSSKRCPDNPPRWLEWDGVSATVATP